MARPPAALAIHLSIGQVYAFSVFKNPLLALDAVGGSAWNLKDVGYIFSIAIAGIVGPLIVNGILDHYVEARLPRQDAYPLILHIMSGLLVVGFIANLLVRPVAEKYWFKDQNVQISEGAAHSVRHISRLYSFHCCTWSTNIRSSNWQIQ